MDLHEEGMYANAMGRVISMDVVIAVIMFLQMLRKLNLMNLCVRLYEMDTLNLTLRMIVLSVSEGFKNKLLLQRTVDIAFTSHALMLGFTEARRAHCVERG